jgi:hypothetical protein
VGGGGGGGGGLSVEERWSMGPQEGTGPDAQLAAVRQAQNDLQEAVRKELGEMRQMIREEVTSSIRQQVRRSNNQLIEAPCSPFTGDFFTGWVHTASQ